MSRVESANIPRPGNIIQNERRDYTDFSVDEMYEFLEGNSAETARQVRDISRMIERDLVLRNKPDYFDTKQGVRTSTLLKVKQFALFMEKLFVEQTGRGIAPEKVDMSDFDTLITQYGVYDPQVCTRIGIHVSLFFNAVRANGTKEQFRYWAFEKGGIFCKEVYGCFGMTELAHGSNVAGLETVAEYDFGSKTFTVNTPHLGATKWWIGGAASSANFCAVYARLVVKGRDYGVKVFIVPLRDSQHHLFPGVSIGDIGAKMGRDGIDNGWIQFTNVKIPKNFMLQKYVKIDDENQEVLDSPMDQLAYGPLLDGRVHMVVDSYKTTSKMVTIALRYAVGRRQFGKTDNPATNFASSKDQDASLKLEKQLIDYPSHQYRLIPLLATSYCMSAAAYRLLKHHYKVMQQLDADDLLTSQKLLLQTIGDLKEHFVVSASTKAASTWFTAKTIDECRQSCGGHGYSAYSNFGKTYDDWVVQCTWEGDNTVLSSNAGRSMVKYRAAAKNGKRVPPSFTFLGSNPSDLSLLDLHSPPLLLAALDTALLNMCDHVLQVLPAYDNNFEKVFLELVAISKFFCQRYYLESAIKAFESNNSTSIKPVLLKVIQLFALYTIKENITHFLKFQLLSKNQLESIDKILFTDLLPFLRHRIVGLTDSFKWSDFFINSPLGSYNGDIYNKYFDMVNMLNPSNSEDLASVVSFLQRPSVEQRELNTKTKETLSKLGN